MPSNNWLKKMKNYSFNSAAFSRGLEKTSNTLHQGITDPQYSAIIDDYNEETTANLMAISLKRVLMMQNSQLVTS